MVGLAISFYHLVSSYHLVGLSRLVRTMIGLVDSLDTDTQSVVLGDTWRRLKQVTLTGFAVKQCGK